MANEGDVNVEFGANAQAALDELTRLMQAVDKSIGKVKNLSDALGKLGVSGVRNADKLSASQVDRLVRNRTATSNQQIATVVNRLVQERIKEIDAAFASVKISDRVFKNNEQAKNNTPALQAARQRINDLNREILALKGTKEALDALALNTLFLNSEKIKNSKLVDAKAKINDLNRRLTLLKSTDEALTALEKNALFADTQRRANTTDRMMKVRERLAQLTRDLQNLKALPENIDAVYRAAESGLGIKRSRGSDFYNARSILSQRADQEAIRRSQMSDTAYSWQRRRETLASNGGADLFATQAQVYGNYMLQSRALSGASFLTNQVVELDKAFKNLQAVTATPMAAMDELKAKLIEVSQTTKFTALEITEAATTMAQAGLSAQEVAQSIESVSLLATASGTSLAESVDVVTSVLGQFDLRTQETTNVANVMTAALNESKLTMDKLALGLQYSGNIAAQAGMSYTELTSVLAGLSNAGIRSGSTLGTGVRQLMLEFLDPSKKLVERLEGLGISLDQVDIKTNTFLGVLKNLEAGGFTVADAMQVLETRSANAFAAIANNIDTIERTDELLTLSTAAAKANDVQMTSLANTWAAFQSNVSAIAYTAFEPFINFLQKALAGVNSLLTAMTEWKSTLQVIGTALAALAGGGLIRWLGRLLLGFRGVVGEMRTMNAEARASTMLSGMGGAGLAGGAGRLGMMGRVGMAAFGGAPGLAIGAGIAGMEAYDYFTETQAERIDAVRSKLEGYKGVADNTQTTITRLREAIESLTTQQRALDDDADARTRKARELEQAFKDLGVTFDTTSMSTKAMIDVLKAVEDSMATDAVTAFNNKIRETNNLIDALGKKQFTSSWFESLLGNSEFVEGNPRSALQDFLSLKDPNFNSRNFQQYGATPEAAIQNAAGPLYGQALRLFEARDVNNINSGDLRSVLTGLSQRLLDLDTQRINDPTNELVQAEIDLIKQLYPKLDRFSSTIMEREALRVQAEGDMRAAIVASIQARPDYVGPESAQLSNYSDRLAMIGQSKSSASSRAIMLENLQADLDRFEAEYEQWIEDRVNEQSEAVIAALGRDGVREAIRQGSLGNRLNQVGAEISKAVMDATDAAQTQAMKDAKLRLRLAGKKVTQLKSQIAGTKSQQDLDKLKADLQTALDEQLAAQVELNTMALEDASSGEYGIDDETKANAEEAVEQLKNAAGEAMDAVVERQAKIAADALKAQLKALDEEISGLKEEQKNITDKMDKAGGPGPAMDALVEAAKKLAERLTGLIDQRTQLLDQIGTGTVSGPGLVGGLAGNNAQMLVQAMMGLGVSKAVASGFVGQMMGESGQGLNPGAYNPKDSNGLPSGGIAQWNGKRFDALQAFALSQHADWKDIKVQIAFLVKELQSNEKATLDALKGAQTVEDGVTIGVRKFERPRDPDGAIRTRLPYGQKVFAQVDVADTFQPATEAAALDATNDKAEVDKNLQDTVDKAAAAQKRLAAIRRDATLAQIESDNDALERLNELTTTSAAQVKESNQQLIANAERIKAERLKALEEQKETIVAEQGQEAYDLMVAEIQKAETDALSSRLNRNYEIYLEKLREQFDVESGAKEARANLSALQAQPEGTVSSGVLENAQRSVDLAEQNRDRMLANTLMAEQVRLQNELNNAQAAGDTAKVSELAAQLQAVQGSIQGLPEHLQAVGGALQGIAGTDVASTLRAATDEFLRMQGMEQIGGRWQMTTQQMADYWQQAMGGMQSSMSSLFKNLASGTMSAEDAFRQFALSIIDNLLNIATTILSNQIMAALFGGIGGGSATGSLGVPLPTAKPGGGGGSWLGSLFSGIGSFFGLKEGTSYIRAANGFNVPTRDSVPILAQPGEAVLKQSAVQMIGREGIDYLNAMGNRRASQVGRKAEERRQEAARPVNVWVVSPDQVPPPGPNDFVQAVTDNIQRGGSIKQLIKTVSSGRM